MPLRTIRTMLTIALAESLFMLSHVMGQLAHDRTNEISSWHKKPPTSALFQHLRAWTSKWAFFSSSLKSAKSWVKPHLTWTRPKAAIRTESVLVPTSLANGHPLRVPRWDPNFPLHAKIHSISLILSGVQGSMQAGSELPLLFLRWKCPRMLWIRGLPRVERRHLHKLLLWGRRLLWYV